MDVDFELQGGYYVYLVLDMSGIPGAPKRIYEHIPYYMWLKGLWKQSMNSKEDSTYITYYIYLVDQELQT